MRQKITIARGLVIDKPVLYLDEPSVSLDVRAAVELRQQIRAYAAKKERCVMMTSHQPEDMAVCDRMLFLHHGASIASGSREDMEKSLENRQSILVKCPSFSAGMADKLRQMKGIASVLIDAEEGKRGETILKVGIHRNEATVSDIIDFFIAGELPVLEIRMKKATLQEVYEHHVNGGLSEQMKDGGVNA